MAIVLVRICGQDSAAAWRRIRERCVGRADVDHVVIDDDRWVGASPADVLDGVGGLGLTAFVVDDEAIAGEATLGCYGRHDGAVLGVRVRVEDFREVGASLDLATFGIEDLALWTDAAGVVDMGGDVDPREMDEWRASILNDPERQQNLIHTIDSQVARGDTVDVVIRDIAQASGHTVEDLMRIYNDAKRA